MSYLLYCFSSFSIDFLIMEVARSSNSMNSNSQVPSVAYKQSLYLFQNLYILVINKLLYIAIGKVRFCTYVLSEDILFLLFCKCRYLHHILLTNCILGMMDSTKAGYP